MVAADGGLQSLGQILSQAREARGLALDEVEMQTRIRVKYLQALESGDLSVLPSATHARGFLRNYAQFLNLDANALVNEFSQMTGAGAPPVTTLTAVPSYIPTERPQPEQAKHYYTEQHNADEVVILPTARPPDQPQPRSSYVAQRDRVGPAVPRGAAVPGYHYQQQPQQEETSQLSRIKGLPGRILHSSIFTIAILIIGFAVIVWATMTQLSQVSIDNIVPSQDTTPIIEEATDATPGVTFAPTSAPTEDTGVVILGQVLIQIEVVQRSWIKVTIDGEEYFSGQVEPGNILNYPAAQNEIVILAGNGGGLIVTYNGRLIGPLGERGEVVERIFTADGNVITPTFTPTVTATNTSVPSPTPRGGAAATATPDE
jgi:transcriptional regulator with XRE-family HTH domain